MRRSHTISLSIDCPLDRAYGYLSRPANYAEWAAIYAETFRLLPDGDWQADTPFGFRHFRFTPPNAFGVLDHAIFVPGGEIRFNPMRVTANDDGVDLVFTLFQREGTTEEQFASTIEWVTTDLLALQSLLEARRR